MTLFKKYLNKILSFIKPHKLVSLVVFIILIFLIYFLIPKQKNTVLTQAAVRSNIAKSISVTGKVSSDKSVNLNFQTSEILSYVGVKKDDIVKKGQLIASLDQNKVAASFRQAQQDFVAAKAASEQYYDGHKNATESYDEKVQRTAIDAAQNKAYDQMLKTQYDLNHSSLYAPFDGIITRIDADQPGTPVTPLTVFSVTDPNSLSFRMEVDEADIGQVTKDQKVNLSLDAFPNDNLILFVDQIDFVSHTTSSGGDAFYVTAKFLKINDYRVGMSGNADIIVDSKTNTITISSLSVFDDNYVYLKTGDKFEKRKVKLGIQNDTDVEIKSGLSVGDLVAIDPGSVPLGMILKK